MDERSSGPRVRPISRSETEPRSWRETGRTPGRKKQRWPRGPPQRGRGGKRLSRVASSVRSERKPQKRCTRMGTARANHPGPEARGRQTASSGDTVSAGAWSAAKAAGPTKHGDHRNRYRSRSGPGPEVRSPTRASKGPGTPHAKTSRPEEGKDPA